jgi:Flp pilus assembly protein TadB
MYFLTMILTGKVGLSIAVALGAFMIPGWIKEWRETRRLVDLSDQLSRVMGMIATSLRRGTPLEAALSEAASNMSYPLGPVLRNMADATVLGVTLSQAVEQVRSLPSVQGSTDFQVFATEMVVCHERGANVVLAFDALRTVLAARRKYRVQVEEHLGQHLIQSLVIAGVGLGVLLAYSQMTPDGLAPLLESVVGQLILAASILGNVFLIRVTHLTLLRQTQRV